MKPCYQNICTVKMAVVVESRRDKTPHRPEVRISGLKRRSRTNLLLPLMLNLFPMQVARTVGLGASDQRALVIRHIKWFNARRAPICPFLTQYRIQFNSRIFWHSVQWLLMDGLLPWRCRTIFRAVKAEACKGEVGGKEDSRPAGPRARGRGGGMDILQACTCVGTPSFSATC